MAHLKRKKSSTCYQIQHWIIAFPDESGILAQHKKATKVIPFRSTEIIFISTFQVGYLSYNPVMSYLSLYFNISGKINFQWEIYNIHMEM